ncbi:MAG TPA: L,D-transpeptidase [Gaiellaceae bacterium]|nr:L,D-transpeptidase [Gaiellaceae bacterium]
MARATGLVRLIVLAAVGTALATAPAFAEGTPPAPATTATVFPAAGQLLVRAVAVRSSPNPKARVIKVMTEFRDDYRIQEIFAVAARTGTDHRPWYKISIPMRPNGTMGWIPAETVSLAPTAGEIRVHRRARTIDLFWHGKRVWKGIVAIGAPGMETPLGHYYVAARFVPYQDPFLGVFAVETSGYSKLTEWPGGGWFGIHGTSMPQLLGQAVSHGCIRVSNLTATKLRRYAPLGTPIVITD